MFTAFNISPIINKYKQIVYKSYFCTMSVVSMWINLLKIDLYYTNLNENRA